MLTESLSFPEAQIALYTSLICNNPMDKIKPTLERKVNLKMHLENYCDFAKLDQINNLDCFATAFGRCASDYNANYFGKVPNLTLCEVQGHEGDSFLSLKDSVMLIWPKTSYFLEYLRIISVNYCIL